MTVKSLSSTLIESFPYSASNASATLPTKVKNMLADRVGYPLVAMVALVETVALGLLAVVTSPAYIFAPNYYRMNLDSLGSSAKTCMDATWGFFGFPPKIIPQANLEAPQPKKPTPPPQTYQDEIRTWLQRNWKPIAQGAVRTILVSLFLAYVFKGSSPASPEPPPTHPWIEAAQEGERWVKSVYSGLVENGESIIKWGLIFMVLRHVFNCCGARSPV